LARGDAGNRGLWLHWAAAKPVLELLIVSSVSGDKRGPGGHVPDKADF